jgi:hypothetical protein
METYAACEVTDNELEKGDPKAKKRVGTRKARYAKARALGYTTLAELRQEQKNLHALKRGYGNRHVDDLAERKARAAKQGYDDLNHAKRAKRAAAKAATEAGSVQSYPPSV